MFDLENLWRDVKGLGLLLSRSLVIACRLRRLKNTVPTSVHFLRCLKCLGYLSHDLGADRLA